MKKRYFMGIDLAKATFDFCLLSENGSRLWQGRLNNDGRGIKQFFSQLRARGWKLQQIHFGLEATGVYGKALVAGLHQGGLAVSVLNPAQVKFFALSVLRPDQERYRRRPGHCPLFPGTKASGHAAAAAHRGTTQAAGA